MTPDIASENAFQAINYIVSSDELRDRFLALSGLSPNELKENLIELSFQASILEFLLSHDPDLISFAEEFNQKPENIVAAWRALGGGAGHEW